MGLDNGITIKIKKSKLEKLNALIKDSPIKDELDGLDVWYSNEEDDEPAIFSKDAEKFANLPDDAEITVEIAYWRKHYGIRTIVMNTLHLPGEGGRHAIDRLDLSKVIREFTKMLNKEEYEELDDYLFWEFEESIDMLRIQLIRMLIVYYFWDELEVKSAIFYDSY